MKRYLRLMLLLIMLALLCACGEKVPTWQEQYDLGVRYLSEGNYEEAIIAFTAAIEIDPKQTPAYVGRGDAYVKLAGSQNGAEETEASKVNYKRALDDYLVAIELDGTVVELYQKAAEIYSLLGDQKSAKDILKNGIEFTRSESLQSILDAMSDGLEKIEETASEGFWSIYIKFEDLPIDDQKYVSMALDHVINDDMSGIVEIAKDVCGKNYFNTILDEYKLSVLYEENVYSSAEDGIYSLFSIQVRTENGTGYLYRVDIIDGRQMTYSNGNCVECDMGYDKASFTCSNWQIDGDFEFLEWGKHTQTFSQGSVKSKYYSDNYTGTIIANLLNGPVAHNSVYTLFDYDKEYNYTHNYVYENGRLIYDDGEPIEDSRIWSPFERVAYERIESFNMQWRW